MNGSEAGPEFLTTEELAARWHTTPAGLHNMRHRSSAPLAVRAGRRLLWRLSEVQAWERARTSATGGRAA